MHPKWCFGMVRYRAFNGEDWERKKHTSEDLTTIQTKAHGSVALHVCLIQFDGSFWEASNESLLFFAFTLQHRCFNWLTISIHVGQVFPLERVQGSAVHCSLSKVQRFTTQTEGDKPAAWAPVLISKQILPLDTSGKDKDQPPWHAAVLGTCSSTLLPDHGNPQSPRCQPGKSYNENKKKVHMQGALFLPPNVCHPIHPTHPLFVTFSTTVLHSS